MNSQGVDHTANVPAEPASNVPQLDNEDFCDQEDESSSGSKEEPTPVLDWRAIQRLRQQRKAIHELTTGFEGELQALRALNKRARVHYDEAAEDEMVAEPYMERPADLPRMTQGRLRKPARLLEKRPTPDEVQAHTSLKKAIKGALRRYACTYDQKRSALFDALADYPK